MSRLKIVLLQRDFSRYDGAYYQHQFTLALDRAHTVFRYGPGLEGYSVDHTIEDVLRACPFNPDLICFGAGWENEDEAIPEFDPHPAINAARLDIPSVMVLNKEYKKLDRKFQFIQENGIRKVFTVHHKYQEWEEQLDVPFVHFPFAVAPELFDDFDLRRSFALGFSGLLQAHHSDIRSRIKSKLFARWPLKRPRYWGIRIFWQDGRRLPFISRTIDDYARLLNRSKIWLSTPSPAELVGTRYYEIMASKTLLFCSKAQSYLDLFQDRENCVMFDPSLGDFDDLLFYYLKNHDERRAIAEAGYSYVRQHHTWDRRIEQFADEVRELL